MLFLNADFWPLFWSVIGGGAVATGLLSLFAAATATASRTHHVHDRAQLPVPAEVARRQTREPARARRAA
jgi:hypothetical protein